MSREQQLERKLREIIADVNAMRSARSDDDNWFGPFERDGNLIEWPNLNILIKEAEEVLHGS